MPVKKTRCHYCNKVIWIRVPTYDTEICGCSCNDCVQRESSARNAVDESVYTEHPIPYRLRKWKEYLQYCVTHRKE